MGKMRVPDMGRGLWSEWEWGARPHPLRTGVATLSPLQYF